MITPRANQPTRHAARASMSKTLAGRGCGHRRSRATKHLGCATPAGLIDARRPLVPLMRGARCPQVARMRDAHQADCCATPVGAAVFGLTGLWPRLADEPDLGA